MAAATSASMSISSDSNMKSIPTACSIPARCAASWRSADRVIPMGTIFGETNWRSMSQEQRDLGLNNSAAVPGSAELVASWEQRSAAMRDKHSAHLDLRYGPRDRNRTDFLKAADGGPTLVL